MDTKIVCVCVCLQHALAQWRPYWNNHRARYSERKKKKDPNWHKVNLKGKRYWSHIRCSIVAFISFQQQRVPSSPVIICIQGGVLSLSRQNFVLSFERSFRFWNDHKNIVFLNRFVFLFFFRQIFNVEIKYGICLII